MNYIELPNGVTKLNNNEDGPFFTYEGQDFNLEDIVCQTREGWFQHEATRMALSVTPFCPKLDKYYVEYLGKSWCLVINGITKAKQIQAILDNTQRYSDRIFIPEDKKVKHAAALKERSEDRYNKGTHSV